MTREEIAEIIRETMPEIAFRKSGSVLYSPASTLSPGSAYIMGLNPGGDPSVIKTAIVDSVAASDGCSAYTHECWQPRCTEAAPCPHIRDDGSTSPSALVRHQKNVIQLTAALGGTPTSISSANAIFARSTGLRTLQAQTGYSLKEWWNFCWPVHQAFLAIVRPRVIVTLGYGETSSAFGLLRASAGFPSHRRFSDEGRGAWAFNAVVGLGQDDSLATTVVGVPHPSYFAPGPALRERLAELSEGRLAA